MNVETPRSVESPAPTRAKIASTTVTVARAHGTKHPICAIKHTTPTERMWQLFPPIFGPVTICSDD